MINPETIRRTVDFAKAQGWIKDPPPRKPGDPCTGKTARHQFKEGVCCYCGDHKPDERGEEMKRDRYPKIPAKGCCRGCGQPVGKGRQTWCSDACYKAKCPALVLRRVYHRDKGVCAICAANTHSLRTAYIEAAKEIKVDYFQFNHDYKAYNEARAKALAAIRPAGFPPHLHWSEIDHIIPFSEGGETIESNLRTLCYPCHKKRTAEWRKSKSKASKTIAHPSLL